MFKALEFDRSLIPHSSRQGMGQCRRIYREHQQDKPYQGWLLKAFDFHQRGQYVRCNSTPIPIGLSPPAESGVILEAKFTLVDPSGTPSTCLTAAMFNLTGKITGQRHTRSVSLSPAVRPVPQDRAPDWVTEEQTSPAGHPSIVSQATIFCRPWQQIDFTRPFDTWFRHARWYAW
ncbi:hypothetical protein EDB87DRAFT_1647670 [Lactarius vividus]|nr:hypothetical protein EDB87DRAFT_1647670 [Lactarius vividus]